MRRSEFLIKEIEIIGEVLSENRWGTLGLVDQGKPYQVPVNFIWYGDCIYFHSALTGRKLELLKKNDNVHFSIVEPLSYIPSYFTDPDMACNATTFFLSVSLEGRATFTRDIDKKAEVLSFMMQRFQPEGKYKSMDSADPDYISELKKTALIEIIPVDIQAKFKLGQNLSREKSGAIADRLDAMGTAGSKRTAALIRRFCKSP